MQNNHNIPLQAILQLMRLDKPVGTLLLLWPTLWAVWSASGGEPELGTAVIFTLGVIVMRAAGCVINDIADRHIDGNVRRTAARPLATKRLSVRAAVLVFATLCSVALVLVLQLNHYAQVLSIIGLGLAVLYPFCKRFTHWPQVVLGAAFNWGIIMAYAAIINDIPQQAWLLYITGVVWTVAYDTIYAMVDLPDDEKIGVKSTAVILGDLTVPVVTAMHGLALLGLVLFAQQLSLAWPFYCCLIPALIVVMVQIKMIQTTDGSLLFRAFLLNQWYGFIVSLGLMLSMT